MENQTHKSEGIGNYRLTAQRHEILEIFDQAQGPLTAAELFKYARKQRPKLGMATLYRTLRIMQETKLIRLVSLPDGLVRYEKTVTGRHHFQCLSCKRIYHMQNVPVPSFKGLVLSNGFLIERHESVFYGRCDRCSARKAQRSNVSGDKGKVALAGQG